jgi:thiol-disulfide isomerase/thioredoxin
MATFSRKLAAAVILCASARWMLAAVPLPDPPIVLAAKAALKRGDLPGAESAVAAYRQQRGDTPEAIEAFSWLARGALAGGLLDQAMDRAEQTRELVRKALDGRGIDSQPYLGLALGAALEVEGMAMDRMGQKSEAVHLLESSLVTYRHTSLVARLRKDLNLLTLTGKAAPPIRMTDLLFGAKPVSATAANGAAAGKVQLLFFWAHWCPDCKAQAPAIARLAASLEPKGLTVIAPTRLYGYAAGGADAAPAAEREYIRAIFDKYYSFIPGMAVPFDPLGFDTYGVSTTPTLVVVDRHGIVRLYHPGTLSEQELRAAIEPLL